MSLNISLIDKKANIIISEMNWLRNPFGLCDWAEANVGDKIKIGKKDLWYVCNHWNYKKSSKIKNEIS